MRQDIADSGFVAHKDKCQWEPVQSGALLGFVMDLKSGTFRVPQRRVESLQEGLQYAVSKGFVSSARSLSRLTGMLVSIGLAIGPVVRLWTRAMYREILQAPSWSILFSLSTEAQQEIYFWIDNFDNGGYPIWSPSPKIDVMTLMLVVQDGGGSSTTDPGKTGNAEVSSWSQLGEEVSAALGAR